MKKFLIASIVALSVSVSFTSLALAESVPYYSANYQLKAEDDLAARQVIVRLNHALDAADYKAYGNLFSNDGVFVSGFGDAVGPKQVEAALEKVAPFITNKRHVAGNLVINGDAKQMVVTSYLIVFERKEEMKYVGSAVNVDTLKKVNGRWLVARHESTLDPATQAYIQSLMSDKKMDKSKTLTPDQVRSAVARYFEGTRSMNATQWASAFATNAVVEDPIGQTPLKTPQAILAQGEGFVTAFNQVGLKEVFVEVNGDEAVAYWHGRGAQKDGKNVRFEGINHFVFDSDGKVVSLRGFWSPANIRSE
jgi:steroid Delta-isomerase